MRSTTFAVPNAATAIAQPGVGRFLLIALSAMAVFYGLIYFPYRAGSLAAHVLSGYVELIAAMAGVMLHLFDGTVAVTGHQISGRFPLNIILDC
jgi:hypothetical protein